MSEKFIRVTSGPSSLEVVEVEDPSAGQNFSTILDEGYTYLLLSCSFQLVASVVVATRIALIEFHLGTHLLTVIPPEGTQVASETLKYRFYVNAYPLDMSAASTDMVARLPARFFIPGGVRIVSDIYAIDVADQISDVTLYLQKWPVLVV